MTSQNFLVEIGTEELPPKSLRQLAQAFADNVTAGLDLANLTHGDVKWFASPRRLAVYVKQLASGQPDSEVVKRGPAIAQAFNDKGEPMPAALGWAKGCGITLDQAERMKTDKGEWLAYTARIVGQPVQALLEGIVAKALAALPIAKPMRWADKPFEFIRPIHTLTMLYGDNLIDGAILGVTSQRIIRGHRVMGQQQLTLNHADDYQDLLKSQGAVIADYEQRKAIIRDAALNASDKLGGVADLSESLLEEVTSLVEWPVVLTAKFEEKFLDVPAEALVHTMKGDQKYFPVYDKQGRLLPYFIFVANIESQDPQQIISGNEKVVRPRLADAEFFFRTDLKQRLEDRLPRLETVLFQQQLGTLRDKTNRIMILSGWIAEQLEADVNQATRAGLLSKCDLMTNMVFEFTETQGVMGMHYARHDGEDEVVAVALNEQYMPRFSGDALPASLVACCVAIADKIDSLVGIFGIGQPPKGDKDPFALRRAALGILRILVEKPLSLDLTALANKAKSLFGEKLTQKDVVEDVVDFMLGRFRSWYLDEGYSVDVIQAVLARRPTDPMDFDARVNAVSYFRQLPEAQALAAANKRVSNILAKVDVAVSDTVSASLLKDKAEITLATHVAVMQDKLAPLFAKNQYQEALAELAQLRQPIDDFFDNVMVMVDDEAVRNNRLALLNQLRQLFLHVADISLLQS